MILGQESITHAQLRSATDFTNKQIEYGRCTKGMVTGFFFLWFWINQGKKMVDTISDISRGMPPILTIDRVVYRPPWRPGLRIHHQKLFPGFRCRKFPLARRRSTPIKTLCLHFFENRFWNMNFRYLCFSNHRIKTETALQIGKYISLNTTSHFVDYKNTRDKLTNRRQLRKCLEESFLVSHFKKVWFICVSKKM